MRNFKLFLIVPFLIGTVHSQTLKKSTPEQLSKMNKDLDINESLGFSDDDVPSSYSFEEFCPSPLKQDGLSCVGWAVAYGAMSTSYNMINNITRPNEKFLNVFDPYYLYAAIKSDDIQCIGSDCDCATHIYEALDLVLNYGVKKMFVSPELECSSTLTRNNLRSLMNRTMYYTIDDYVQLIDYEEIEGGDWKKIVDIELIKSALYYNMPVVSGIDVESRFNLIGSNNSLYQPKYSGETGGHAVTIVGYNDNLYGGAFRILNSYGDEWGDEGFFWLSYKDFERTVGTAFVMKANYDNWTRFYSKDGYYKGEFAANEDLKWEGGINSENFFDGLGILTAQTFMGWGEHNNGEKSGWWMILDNIDGEDSFSGWVLFENGEITDVDEFGFSSSTVKSIESVISDFHLEKINIPKGGFNDAPATKNDFTKDKFNKRKVSGVIR